MNIKALQLESRFSLPPNSLGYCGKNTAAEKLKNCIINGECTGVEKEVTKFIVLFPYLKTISQVTKKPIFSYEVIEAYWIGNDLLKQFKPKHYSLLLENFKTQGVPDFFIEELRLKKPKKFFPNHLFQVLHVGVGKASGVVPFNLESINNCMIRWGKVTGIDRNKAVINLHSLTLQEHVSDDNKPNSRHPELVSGSNEMLKLAQHDKQPSTMNYELSTTNETIPFDLKLTPNLKPGVTVTVHWSTVVKILTKDEEQKLSFWIKEVIDNL